MYLKEIFNHIYLQGIPHSKRKTTSNTKYAPSTDMEDIFINTVPHTDPQPMELDTSISDTTTEIIPDVLRLDENNKILITVRHPVRSTQSLLLTLTIVKQNAWMETKIISMINLEGIFGQLTVK